MATTFIGINYNQFPSSSSDAVRRKPVRLLFCQEYQSQGSPRQTESLAETGPDKDIWNLFLNKMIFCHEIPQWLLPPAGGQCSELSDWGVTNCVWGEETPPTDLSALWLSSLHLEKLLGKFLCLLQSISMRGNNFNVQMSTCNEEGLKCVDSVEVPGCLNPCQGFIILKLLSDIIINISRSLLRRYNHQG